MNDAEHLSGLAAEVRLLKKERDTALLQVREYERRIPELCAEYIAKLEESNRLNGELEARWKQQMQKEAHANEIMLGYESALGRISTAAFENAENTGVPYLQKIARDALAEVRNGLAENQKKEVWTLGQWDHIERAEEKRKEEGAAIPVARLEEFGGTLTNLLPYQEMCVACGTPKVRGYMCSKCFGPRA